MKLTVIIISKSARSDSQRYPKKLINYERYLLKNLVFSIMDTIKVTCGIKQQKMEKNVLC